METTMGKEKSEEPFHIGGGNVGRWSHLGEPFGSAPKC